ncbi:YceI family protein [Chitinasiproducens palmae]|uniref:Polyisoprenoid-binding protein YceI n=1 Tax=Chitinasiproducens palmae TaxID=1770053 RepID=A0A1H2PTI1_9BURK|nr:YceI family protein [Chitinasiproducens palmae]SDV50389.1 Polyisoprenoid-binding protein YceI [Chitinasiproducens palmae]
MTLFRFTTFARAVAGAALLAAAPVASFADTLAPGSTVDAVFKQMGVPVTGHFKTFSATLQFDPAHPEKSQARIDVDTNSFDLGEASFNTNARGKDWLDTAAHPKATFVSTSIKSAGPGTFTVAGKLTIRGKTVDTTTTVKFQQNGKQQVFDGTLPINRLTYGVGQGDWADTSVVAADVQLRFHLVTAGK